MVFKEIKNINNFSRGRSVVPENHDLVVTERGSEIQSAIWLSGFEEVGLFDHLMKSPPVYGFIGDA